MKKQNKNKKGGWITRDELSEAIMNTFVERALKEFETLNNRKPNIGSESDQKWITKKVELIIESYK